MASLFVQITPAAGVWTDAYTTPFASEQDNIDLAGMLGTFNNARRRAKQGARFLALWVCNLSTVDTFSIQIAPGGTASANTQYLYTLQPLPYPGTFNADFGTAGYPLVGSDVIRVFSTGGFATFHLIGDELI